MAFQQGEPPFIKTPLTDFSSLFGLMDIQMIGSPLCKKFELRYFNCLEAYGVEKGSVKCSDIYDDLVECKYGEKQRARLMKMREELQKQIKEGKRTYSEPPELDTAYQVYF